MPPLTPAQLIIRSTFIGGSDAASICGVNPYKTAFEVYQDKIGLGKPVIETEAMRWGTLHEDTIKREFARLSGRTIVDDLLTISHATYPFMGCHVDARERDLHKTGEGVVECKATRRSLKKGECPESYQIQLFHNMICTDLKWGTVVILIQGSELVWYDFTLTDTIKESIVALESRFWKAVEAKEWSLFGVD